MEIYTSATWVGLVGLEPPASSLSGFLTDQLHVHRSRSEGLPGWPL